METVLDCSHLGVDVWTGVMGSVAWQIFSGETKRTVVTRRVASVSMTWTVSETVTARPSSVSRDTEVADTETEDEQCNE